MRTQMTLSAVVCFVVSASYVPAVVAQDALTVFLSDNDTFSDLNTTLDNSVTDSSFDIWVQTSALMAGISLDITATGNAIQLTNAMVLNPSSTGGGSRWAFAQNGQLTPPNSIVSIEGGAFIGLSGAGIGPSTASDDAEYDANIDAFKYATVNYDVLGEGTSELVLNIGGNFMGFNDLNNPAPIYLGIGDGLVSNVGGATGSMIDGTITVVPEPQSVLLFGLGCIAVGCLRVRRHRT